MPDNNHLLLITLINLAATFANTAWVWFDKKTDRSQAQFKALSDKVEQLDKDVAALDASAKKSPTHDDLGDVYESIKLTDAKLNELIGVNKAQSDLLRQINAALVNKGVQQ